MKRSKKTFAAVLAATLLFLSHANAAEVQTEIPIFPGNAYSIETFERVWEYAVKTGQEEIGLQYDTPGTPELRGYFRTILQQTNRRCTHGKPEQYGYFNAKTWHISNITSEGFVLHIKFALRDDTVTLSMRNDAENAAKEIRESLYAAGTLSSKMTDREKAKAYTKWIVNHVAYLDEDNALCHTAYSAIIRHTGVCDAYVAALQTFLQLENIPCNAIVGHAVAPGADSSALHSWTRAKLDGTWLNIDPTWCDAANQNAQFQLYFAIPDKEFFTHHFP